MEMSKIIKINMKIIFKEEIFILVFEIIYMKGHIKYEAQNEIGTN